MKSLKYNGLLLIALLISVTAFSQRHRGEMRHERPPHLIQMQEELQLSDEQVAEIKAISEKYREKAEALHNDTSDDPTERRSAMQELREQQREEIHGVLTEQQLKQLEEKRQARETAREEHQAKKKELHQKLKSYHQENILPVLKTQRAKLEAEISQADKALIDELRAVHQAMGEKKKEAKGDPEKREALRESWEDHREMMEQLKGLVEKYEEDIERLYTDILDQRQQWRKDMKALHESYKPEDSPRGNNRMEAPRNGMRMGKADRLHREGPRGKAGKRMHKGPGHMMGKGQFLLLDPNATVAGPPARGAVTPDIETRVFPNPARQTNTLRYTLPEAGQVRIELRDSDGRLVKVLLDEALDAGEHQIEVDLSQLSNGVYYYTISGKEGQVTRKMIVSKE